MAGNFASARVDKLIREAKALGITNESIEELDKVLKVWGNELLENLSKRIKESGSNSISFDDFI